MTAEQWTEFKEYMIGEPGVVLFISGLILATLMTLAMYWHRTSQITYKQEILTTTMKIKGGLANAIFVYFGLRLAGIWVETSQFILWAVCVGLVSDKIGIYAARSGGIITKLVNRRLKVIEEKVNDVQESQNELKVSSEKIIDRVEEIKSTI